MTGLLLVNLGTPDEPTAPAVRRYLDEFLSDPRVLDINPVGRWLLLHGVILRTRPAKSAEAYRKVWDPARGSPLLYHSLDLAAAVQQALGDDWKVVLAMRYGQPPIRDGIAALRAARVDRIVVLPLFPQYASSSTGSALEEVFRVAAAGSDVPSLSVVPPFFDHPGFVGAFAAVGRGALDAFRPDRVLFSFHGLPERHMTDQDRELGNAHCLASADCCATLTDVNRRCYRAQCHATARALAGALGLDAAGWSLSFQSRLGRTPWIKPYTDVVLD